MVSRILVVDDEPEIVHTIQMNLEKQGYEVETASSGAEALAKMQADCPNLLITDMMPKMDGVELMSSIHHDPILADLRVIMMTTKQEERDFLEEYRIGADMYLAKPFDAPTLLRYVQTLLAYRGDGESRFDRLTCKLDFIHFGPCEAG